MGRSPGRCGAEPGEGWGGVGRDREERGGAGRSLGKGGEGQGGAWGRVGRGGEESRNETWE